MNLGDHRHRHQHHAAAGGAGVARRHAGADRGAGGDHPPRARHRRRGRSGERGDRAHARRRCASSRRSPAGTGRRSRPSGPRRCAARPTRPRSSSPPPRSWACPIEVIDGAARGGADLSRGRRRLPRRARRARWWWSTSAAARRRSWSPRAATVKFNVSLPLGSVRLTERYIRHDPPRPDEIAALHGASMRALAGVPFPVPGSAPITLVGVAGTVTSLAAMAEALVELRSGARARLPAVAGGARRADRPPARRHPGRARADRRASIRAAPT